MFCCFLFAVFNNCWSTKPSFSFNYYVKQWYKYQTIILIPAYPQIFKHFSRECLCYHVQASTQKAHFKKQIIITTIINEWFLNNERNVIANLCSYKTISYVTNDNQWEIMKSLEKKSLRHPHLILIKECIISSNTTPCQSCSCSVWSTWNGDGIPNNCCHCCAFYAIFSNWVCPILDSKRNWKQEFTDSRSGSA